MKKRKLKNYILFPSIQLKFLLITIITVLLTVGFCFYQLHASFNHLISVGKKMGLEPDAAYFRLLHAQENLILKNSILGLIAAIVLSLIFNFVITHRALGPFYRMKVFFKNYQKGSGQKIKFRETDYFREIEEDINKALD